MQPATWLKLYFSDPPTSFSTEGTSKTNKNLN